MAYTQYVDSYGTVINNYGYVREIWDFFIDKGLSPDAVASLMGNLYAESMLVPYIKQGDVNYPFSASWDYTEQVNDGTISRAEFVQFGSASSGYGLAQWTTDGRKSGYYDYWKSTTYSSIGNCQVGCYYVWQELQTGWSSTLKHIKGDYSLRDKTVFVMKYYEAPLNQSTDAQNHRYNVARCIYEYMNGTTYQDPEDDHSGTGGGSGGGNAPPSNNRIISSGIMLRSSALRRRF